MSTIVKPRIPMAWVFLLVLVSPLQAQETTPTTEEPPSRSEVQRWVREEVRDAIEVQGEDFRDRSEQTLAEARDTRDYAGEQVSKIIDLVALFFTVLTAILAVAAALGVVQFFRLRNLARHHIAAAREAAKQAGEAADRIDGIRSRLIDSLGDIPGAFDALPAVAPFIAGASQGAKPEIRVLFEDRDNLLIVADQLGLMPEPAKAAEYFRKVARYWRFVDDLPRALARLERAKELAPENPAMSLAEARTLATWAAGLRSGEDTAGGGDQEQRDRYLKRALANLDEAEAKAGGPRPAILHYRAWCEDERGNYETAEKLYRRALTMEPDRSLWEFDDEPADLIRHNLVCCLCNAGKYDAALEELEVLAATPANRRDLQLDPELQYIRETPPWRERFNRLVGGTDPAAGGAEAS